MNASNSNHGAALAGRNSLAVREPALRALDNRQQPQEA